jgi:hypothetical protein
MKAYIITALKDRVIFPDNRHNEIVLNAKEYTLLTGQKVDSNISMGIYYKGYNNQQPCVMDFINKEIKEINFNNISVKQIENLLRL